MIPRVVVTVGVCLCLAACRSPFTGGGASTLVPVVTQTEPEPTLEIESTLMPPASPTVELERAVSETTPTGQPTSEPTVTESASPTPALEVTATITLTVLYDNQPGDPSLTTAWGFSCLIETPKTTLLFDTGGDAATLLDNAVLLDKDLSEIDAVVLSHYHQDHTGGLEGLLSTGITPTVYVLASFPLSIRQAAGDRATIIEVTDPRRLDAGIWTTGEVGGLVPEQALVVETTEGWVLITGCAHPGVETMAERALEIVDGQIRLALGGYHLGSASPGAIAATVAALQTLGVAAVAPTHCSGAPARSAFAEAYGEAYTAAGVGSSWVFERTRPSE